MKISRQNGSILVSILAILAFLGTMILSLVLLANSNLIRARSRIISLQAQYAAESAADSALAILNSGNTSYAGTSTDTVLLDSSQYKATYSVSVAAGSDAKEKIITAVGKVYSPSTATTPQHTRTLRITAQRTSTESASSILSRNIIDVASGVKEIVARDIYVNGFIMMHKNTTDLIAENITVGGKNTGSTNCSIGGSGALKKSETFTDPTQTKTNLNLAFNNCITPPGNTSNADFNVAANQGSISTVESTYIPWSQYMDSGYTDANNCNDWTTGGTTRAIPGTSSSKKTHYPDSGSNISTTCGTSGDLALGTNQYNITDHVHVRANFCAAAACGPTFYNPDTTVKFVFVEGTVNFYSVKTVAGSGPIVLIVSGADPASKTSVCPYGGSVYIGQSGSDHTDAKALYILAANGLCIDGTKFNSASADEDEPVFGGVAGKNLYVSSSPSTPRPLLLDPTFPVDQIPIDLAWRATRYQRM